MWEANIIFRNHPEEFPKSGTKSPAINAVAEIHFIGSLSIGRIIESGEKVKGTPEGAKWSNK